MKKRYLSFFALFICLSAAFQMRAHAAEIDDLHLRALEEKEEWGDVAGWLLVPGTPIDEAVLQGEDNSYYMRRNLQGQYEFAGSVFADFRCDFSGGTCGSTNTVIYANSFTDDPEASDAKKFDHLKRYKDEAFAKEHPYLYFSDTAETMVWEIFAVSIVSIELPYNEPEPGDRMMELVQKVREASLHPFSEVEVTASDRLLTLTTVDYSEGSDLSVNRFVVMAKLIDQQEEPAVTEPGPEAEDNHNPNTGR